MQQKETLPWLHYDFTEFPKSHRASVITMKIAWIRWKHGFTDASTEARMNLGKKGDWDKLTKQGVKCLYRGLHVKTEEDEEA